MPEPRLIPGELPGAVQGRSTQERKGRALRPASVAIAGGRLIAGTLLPNHPSLIGSLMVACFASSPATHSHWLVPDKVQPLDYIMSNSNTFAGPRYYS